MGLVTVVEAAAGTYVVGETEIMDGNWAEVDNWSRKVVRAGLGGSDALEECEIDLYYGSHKVANIRNTQTTGALTDDDLVPISSRLTCRAGEPIRAVLRGSQSATTALKLILDIKDMARRRRF